MNSHDIRKQSDCRSAFPVRPREDTIHLNSGGAPNDCKQRMKQKLTEKNKAFVVQNNLFIKYKYFSVKIKLIVKQRHLIQKSYVHK